ncbi:MAG: DNA ligase D [Rhodanobacteraceae bacterium]
MAGRRAPKLAAYRRKRRFEKTPEPATTPRRRQSRKATEHTRKFVIHLHHARRRHFDLRLQTGNVLRSWAVPKGPSRDPAAKRLAIEVEDHPLSYANFEGNIPEGHYGAGEVAIWDEGTWSTPDSIEPQIEKGHLRFELHGARLHGHWSLVRTRLKGKQPQWLLIKSDDAFAMADDVADDVPLSEWEARQTPKESLPQKRNGADRTPKSNAVGSPKGRLQDAPGKSRKSSKAKALDPGSPLHGVRDDEAVELPGIDDFEFQLARLHQVAPEGDGWLHEVKFDGYRMLARRNGNNLQLLSRNRLDWTQKLPAVAKAIRALKCRACVLDGELVVFDEHGHSRFDLLQQEFNRAESHAVRYAVFDLPWLDGDDLRAAPLHERKAALRRLLKSAGDELLFSDFIRGNGALAYQEACKAGLEGIISKAADAPYRGGRGNAWRKLKCIDSDEFVIVGYTPGKGSRGPLGALLLAEPQDKNWRYVGRVGTGMDDATLQHLHVLLKPARTAPKLIDPPDAKQLRGAKPIWVQPRQVAEISFRGRTGDDLLRQASFKGLRPDKSPADLRDSDRSQGGRPMPSKSAAASEVDVRLTHPDRVLIEKPRVSKRDLAEFYSGIAEHLLPGMTGRPLSLVRCPEGSGEECFYQKHPMAGMPEAVHVGDARELRGKQNEFVFVDDIDGVLGLVQMNVIEFHPWGSTIDDLEHPDRLVFDLDPDSGVAWPRVRSAAKLLRERLQAVGLTSFLRTTGGKGLHVVVPLNPRPDWENAKAFAHALARTLEQEAPEQYVSAATKTRRKNRIFIDYLRNARGATAVASYCVRARPGAGVATPLRWEELSRLRSGAQYTISNIKRRLKSMKQDPWQGFDEVRQALPKT